MSGDGASWPTGPPADHDFDVSGANLFTEELANVDATEWDVDTAALWGDAVDETDLGAAPLGPDLFL